MSKFEIPPIVFVLEEKIKKLEEELEYYRTGLKGACPTCEDVATLNQELMEIERERNNKPQG